MLRFSFSQARIEKNDLEKTTGKILGYEEEVLKKTKESGYLSAEHFINLPDDREVYEKIRSLLKEKGEKIRTVIVAGIGGSSLGTQAVYEALKEERGLNPIWFFDTISAGHLIRLREFLKTVRTLEEIVVIVVSKSGTTLETVVNSEAILLLLGNQFGEKALERCIVISDKGSHLWKKAEKRGVVTLEIPEKIGGRFSVFSPVGLAPLAFAGVDIEALRDGAQEMKDTCLTEVAYENPALTSASLLFLYGEQGRDIHDIFLSTPELESLGKWYRALLAESLGKEGKGITPTVSIGTIDMHSFGQLTHGGPHNKSMEIVSIERNEEDMKLTENTLLAGEDEKKLVGGRSVGEISAALFEGIKKSYSESEMPFFEVVLPGIDEHSLGAFIMYKMCEVIWLAKLLEVNGFNQPDVEKYKRYARDILGKRK